MAGFIMNPEDFVEYIKGIKTPDERSENFYNGEGRTIVSDNLLLYLKKMQKLNPTVLLVGEAPGYKGCKLTGVPFASEYQIVSEYFFNDGFKVRDPEKPDKELSAGAIWEVLREVDEKPLIWNIYPFHPVKPDGRNGKPRSRDIKLGKEILEKLLTMFDIKEIYCIGRVSMYALESDPIYKGYVRHPAQGGRTECIKRLKEIFKK